MWTLYELSYSPWSEKARWALDHHRARYRRVGYVPIFGAIPLRLRARHIVGRTSVPTLLTESGAYVDSLVIARYVESRVAGTPRLFGSAVDARIEEWNARVEHMMSAGRGALIRRMVSNPEALRESLPPVFPAWLRAVGAPIAHFGAWFIARKYGRMSSAEAEIAVMVDFCQILRVALERRRSEGAGDVPTLLERFTFADIAAASAIQFFAPVADRYLALGPATRAACTIPELATEFADLVAWRDAIYARHRAPKSP